MNVANGELTLYTQRGTDAAYSTGLFRSRVSEAIVLGAAASLRLSSWS